MSSALPPGWRHGTLADVIASISTGVSVNGEDRPMREGEVGVLKITAVLHGVFEPEHHKAVVPADLHRVTCPVRGGTVLVSRSNTADLVGASAYVPEDVPGLFLPDKLWALTAAEGVNPRWLGYVLADPAFRPHLAGASNGTSGSMKNIPQQTFLRLRAAIPPRREQDRMVEILMTWDAGIRRAEDLRHKVASALSAYLRQHLHHAHGATIEVRDGWRIEPLASVGRIVSGGTPSTGQPHLWDGGIPWITPAEITALKSRYATETARTISEAGLRTSAAEILPEGSLIVCTRASVGEMAINTVPMATNQGFKSVVPGDRICVEFLYYYMRANLHALERLAAGSTFSEVSKTAFEGIPIAFPPLSEQRKVAGLLGALDDQLAGLQSLIEKLQVERRGLMSGLLSGRIRHPDDATGKRVEIAHA